jgi:excisionase family DNA binding protein
LSDYMHCAEAAEYLGIHHNTIRKWAARGELPVRRNLGELLPPIQNGRH